jgi:hypothetical protein
MNTRFKNSLIVAAVAAIALAGIGSALAQSYLDGSAKMRGDYGQMSRSQASPMYRYTTPNQQRSFSYEPDQPASQPSQSTSGCGGGHADNGKATTSNPPTAPQGGIAQKGTQAYSSYSYEPGTSSGTMRSRSNSTPLWALPKTDSRKFGGQ